MTKRWAGAALLLQLAAHSVLGQETNAPDVTTDQADATDQTDVDLETSTVTPTQIESQEVEKQEFAMTNRPGAGLVVQHLSFADMSDGSVIMNMVVDAIANDSVYSNVTESAPKVYLIEGIANCALFPTQGTYPAQEIVVMNNIDEGGQVRFSSGELSYSKVMMSCPAVLSLKSAANSSKEMDETPRGFAWSMLAQFAQQETPEDDYEDTCCSGERNPRLLKSQPSRLRSQGNIDLSNFNIIATGSIVRFSAPAPLALVAAASPASSGSVSTWPNIILAGINNSVLLPIAAIIVVVYAFIAYAYLLSPVIQAVVPPTLGTSRAWRRLDAVVDDLAVKADVAIRGFASRIRVPKRVHSYYTRHKF